MYLRRNGWTDSDTFSIQTLAGEIRPTITGPTTCRVDMGRAKLQSDHFPGGPKDGRGTIEGYAFQHVQVGNPQCAIRVEHPEAIDLQQIGQPSRTRPSSPIAPTSRSGPSSTLIPSAPASSNAAWGRRFPQVPERRGPPSPTCSGAATRP